jgi:hypothetical protein
MPHKSRLARYQPDPILLLGSAGSDLTNQPGALPPASGSWLQVVLAAVLVSQTPDENPSEIPEKRQAERSGQQIT